MWVAQSWQRLLCVVMLAALVTPGARAEDTPAGSPLGADFLQSVIGRMASKQDTQEEGIARPVQDLQAALERVSGTMAAAAVQQVEEIRFTDPNLPEAEVGVQDPASASAIAYGGDHLHADASGVTTSLTAPIPIGAPALTEAELAALYQAAANKGLMLDVDALKGGYLPSQTLADVPNDPNAIASPDNPGYYYYFFPIKNLADQKAQALQQQQHAIVHAEAQAQAQHNHALSHSHLQVPAPLGQHENLASVEQAAALAAMGAMGADVNALMAHGDTQKSVEPLFMAVAGFIGMAMMFVISVLFLPKWGALRSRGVTALKHAPDELASLTRLVVQSIEGKDCSERIACEVGRAVRTMRLGNKPLRVLEILLPPSLSKQIEHIRKAVKKAEKCNFIPCKFRPVPLPPTQLRPQLAAYATRPPLPVRHVTPSQLKQHKNDNQNKTRNNGKNNPPKGNKFQNGNNQKPNNNNQAGNNQKLNNNHNQSGNNQKLNNNNRVGINKKLSNNNHAGSNQKLNNNNHAGSNQKPKNNNNVGNIEKLNNSDNSGSRKPNSNQRRPIDRSTTTPKTVD